MPTNPIHSSATALRRRRLAAVLALLGMLGGVVLFAFDPTQCGFYPSCLFHQLTGLACPGCGGLRALHQLAHGHLAQAFHLNPLLVLFVPIALWLLAWQLAGKPVGIWVNAIFSRPPWPWVLAGVVILFGVLRNLPFPPFAFLSP